MNSNSLKSRCFRSGFTAENVSWAACTICLASGESASENTNTIIRHVWPRLLIFQALFSSILTNRFVTRYRPSRGWIVAFATKFWNAFNHLALLLKVCFFFYSHSRFLNLTVLISQVVDFSLWLFVARIRFNVTNHLPHPLQHTLLLAPIYVSHQLPNSWSNHGLATIIPFSLHPPAGPSIKSLILLLSYGIGDNNL